MEHISFISLRFWSYYQVKALKSNFGDTVCYTSVETLATKPTHWGMHSDLLAWDESVLRNRSHDLLDSSDEHSVCEWARGCWETLTLTLLSISAIENLEDHVGSKVWLPCFTSAHLYWRTSEVPGNTGLWVRAGPVTSRPVGHRNANSGSDPKGGPLRYWRGHAPLLISNSFLIFTLKEIMIWHATTLILTPSDRCGPTAQHSKTLGGNVIFPPGDSLDLGTYGTSMSGVWPGISSLELACALIP